MVGGVRRERGGGEARQRHRGRRPRVTREGNTDRLGLGQEREAEGNREPSCALLSRVSQEDDRRRAFAEGGYGRAGLHHGRGAGDGPRDLVGRSRHAQRLEARAQQSDRPRAHSRPKEDSPRVGDSPQHDRSLCEARGRRRLGCGSAQAVGQAPCGTIRLRRRFRVIAFGRRQVSCPWPS